MATSSPTALEIAEPWAAPADAVLAALDSAPGGLTDDEAQRRLGVHGPNLLARQRGTPWPIILLRQLRSALVYVLLIAAAITLALGEVVDAAVIAFALLLNTVLGFIEEHRAERSLEALRSLARARARVLRDGRERELDAGELVPGDVVLLEAGVKVPGDCRILHATMLEVDESLLTGESATVGKSSAPVDAAAAVADRHGMAFMGTLVTRGRARAVVTATGASTELGRIAGAVQRIGPTETPLQKRMGRFTRLVGLWALSCSLIGFAFGAAHGEDLTELFRAMVALAVAAVPEGLPIVLTVTLAISVGRMARRGAIVRRLPAVETLGSCTIIGSDKTGTLTENRMTVERVVAGGVRYDVSGDGHRVRGRFLAGGDPVEVAPGIALELTLRAAALANDGALGAPAGDDDEPATAGDPTEVALLIAAAKAGLFKNDLEERYPRVADIPFDSDRRYAATFNRDGDRTIVFVKGAPEQVLDLCADALERPQLDREAILADAHAMAADGLRVLAVAHRDLGVTAPTDDVVREHPTGLTFLGLTAMMDPPREGVRDAVARCRRAGIRPLMITGDHAATALAIARQLGIADDGDRAITGPELDALDDEELERLVAEVSVFARAAPEHKLRLVQALRRRGEVVAVTGDGVNDAPALKQADIGAAMGRTGTDAAKEAADMVITDDNFATVFAAVEEGRVAFDNVRKTAFFLISGNAAAVLAVLFSLGADLALPFLAVQLLWLNIATNGVQDIALAFEPGEKHLVDRPPRPPTEGIISPVLWERTVIAALVMAAGTLVMFHLAADRVGVDEARSVALTTMVVFQALHVGNARSETLSAFAKSPFSNRFLFVGTLGAVALHAAALYLPVTQYLLDLEPIALRSWLEIVAMSLTVIVVVELHKAVRRRWPIGGRAAR
ncbi:MAG TPA: HAD-IC family P-type ATPase [Capillimicrobium sp.]|nr:HAD-IC family P-type ATPase [Capillimicrobium sp.]